MLVPQAPSSFQTQRLGSTLQAAGLLSLPQLEVALRDQTQYWDLRLGEILDLRGWVKQQTSDFFAEQFSKLLIDTRRYRLGLYLREASLLNHDQVRIILEQQLQTSDKFGTLAVQNGWLHQQTLDFFLMHLSTTSDSAQLNFDTSSSSEASLVMFPSVISKSTVLQMGGDSTAWLG